MNRLIIALLDYSRFRHRATTTAISAELACLTSTTAAGAFHMTTIAMTTTYFTGAATSATLRTTVVAATGYFHRSMTGRTN